MLKPLFLVLTCAAFVAVAAPAPRTQSRPMQEWPVYATDAAATHYSPLSDIDPTTVKALRPAWEWKPAEETLSEYGTRPGMFENTPLMIDNVLYLSTPYNRVVALDAETGAERWTYDPKAYEDGQPPNGTGFVHRGVAAWRDSEALRIFMNSRTRLLSRRGRAAVESFGVARGRSDARLGWTSTRSATRTRRRHHAIS